MLLLSVGDARYAIECQHIVEIVPKVNLKEIPHVPEYIVGMLNFRGVPVPIVDLCRLLQDRPCATQYHTRIVILNIPIENGESCQFGLLAERVTETVDYDPNDFLSGGLNLKDTPYLGGVLTEGEHEVQYLMVDKIFSLVKDTLFSL